METVKRYENYPIWIVILSNLVSLAIYGLGFVIIFRLGLIAKFDSILLFTLILLLILTTIGNGFIRGKLTCKYCKQRELGCPADRLFNKEK